MEVGLKCYKYEELVFFVVVVVFQFIFLWMVRVLGLNNVYFKTDGNTIFTFQIEFAMEAK